MENLALWLAIAFIGGLAVAIGWSHMDLSEAHKRTDSDLTDLRETVARDYALRRDVKDDLQEIKKTLKELFDLMRANSGNR